jgi:hypothetical protein
MEWCLQESTRALQLSLQLSLRLSAASVRLLLGSSPRLSCSFETSKGGTGFVGRARNGKREERTQQNPNEPKNNKSPKCPKITKEELVRELMSPAKRSHEEPLRALKMSGFLETSFFYNPRSSKCDHNQCGGADRPTIISKRIKRGRFVPLEIAH